MDASAAAAWVGIVITLGIAIVGWHRGLTADRHAAEALKLAQRADERADRLERLATERRDVTWVRHKRTNEAGWLTFVNAGSDTAHDVRLIVDPPDGQRREESVIEVAPTDTIGLQLLDLHLAERRRASMLAEQGIFGTGAVQCRGRILWRSASGVEDSVELDEKL